MRLVTTFGYIVTSLALVCAQVTPQDPSLPLATRLFNLGKNTIIGTPPIDQSIRAAADVQAGITRLTDGNYGSRVENGNANDVWVVVLHGATAEPLNHLFLDAHTNATILAKKSNMTENVHWAQVDYATEPGLMSKWLIFRPPYIVIAEDQGRKLRFFGPKTINARGETLHKFIEIEGYREHAPWNSAYGPGGDREWFTNLYIEYYSKWTEFSAKVPNFAWLLLTGAVTRSLMSWMHPGPTAPQPLVEKRTPTQAQVQREKALRAALLKKGGNGKKA